MLQRVERDEFGELTLPAHALYGIQTARALENLSFSGRALGSCPAYVRALGMVKAAAARANREAGVLQSAIADAIARATEPLRAATLLEHFPADLLGGGGSIGVHMNVNEVVANLANEALGGIRGTYEPVHPLRHVNASQSTADVCHTALRLAILAEWPGLDGALAAVAQSLSEHAQTMAATTTLARTCLQDAFPVALGELFRGYAVLTERRRGELARTVAALHAVALGGTVIGTGAGAPPTYRERVIPFLAELAELRLRPREHRPDALQNSDDVAAVSAQLAQLALGLIKIAQDVRLLASGPRGGFGEIELPYLQAGSSFFAGKNNPVVPETLLQCAFQILGCDRAVQAAVEHAELYLNVFDGLAAVNVLDALGLLTRALRRFDTHALRGLRANADRCRSLAALGRAP